jgi:DNA-binding transcriptional LysR family regulator
VAIPILAHGFLPSVIGEFLKDYPDVSIVLETVQSSPTVVDWVASRQYDVGLAVVPVEHPAITVRPFSRRRALCVLPGGHPLGGKPAIRAADLERQNFISFQRASVFQFRVDEAFEKAGVRPRPRVEASTRQAACDLVAAGVGVAVVGPIFTIEKTDRRLLFRPFEPPIYLEHGMLFPAFNPMSLVTERFAKLVVDYTERHFPSDP